MSSVRSPLPTAAKSTLTGAPIASPATAASGATTSGTATATSTTKAQAPTQAVDVVDAPGSATTQGVPKLGERGQAVPLALRARLGATTTTKTADSAHPHAVTDAEQQAHETLNAKVLKKYPSLAPALTNPDAFMATMQERFAAQKAQGADPYAFDFSEWGVPALKGLSAAIGEKLDELDPFMARLLPTRDKAVEDHINVARLLSTMRDDIHGALAAQEKGEPLPYRRVQELSFFVARTIGLMDLPKLSWQDRAFLAVDRYLQGFEVGTFEREARRYADNDFSVFQKKAPKLSGFDVTEATFERAFFNPEKLEMLALPTIEELGPEPFTRLAPYNLFLLGVTKEPAAADGFVRPGADFYMHDMRHSSAMFHKRREYEAKHGLNDAQIEKIAKRSDLWKFELDEARKSVPDKQLRWAIGFLMFNFHHDRGYPLVPSSYVKDTAVDRVPRLLHAMLKISGQPTGFDKPKETMQQAFEWLRAFWLPRLGEEQAILAPAPPLSSSSSSDTAQP